MQAPGKKVRWKQVIAARIKTLPSGGSERNRQRNQKGNAEALLLAKHLNF